MNWKKLVEEKEINNYIMFQKYSTIFEAVAKTISSLNILWGHTLFFFCKSNDDVEVRRNVTIWKLWSSGREWWTWYKRADIVSVTWTNNKQPYSGTCSSITLQFLFIFNFMRWIHNVVHLTSLSKKK